MKLRNGGYDNYFIALLCMVRFPFAIGHHLDSSILLANPSPNWKKSAAITYESRSMLNAPFCEVTSLTASMHSQIDDHQKQRQHVEEKERDPVNSTVLATYASDPIILGFG